MYMYTLQSNTVHTPSIPPPLLCIRPHTPSIPPQHTPLDPPPVLVPLLVVPVQLLEERLPRRVEQRGVHVLDLWGGGCTDWSVP